MASTQSKLSGSGKNGARSVSSSRLVAAAKSTTKPQKLTAAVKPRTTSSAPAPITKASRWPKAKTPSIAPAPAAATKSERPAASGGATAGDAATRSGVSKTELKAQFAKLSAAISQIGSLKRAINKSFFEIGLLLVQIRNERLYEVKGYGSFESFVEREIGLPKAQSLRIARIAETIHREQALAAGLDRAMAAVAALDGESEPGAGFRPAGSPLGGIPVHKQ